MTKLARAIAVVVLLLLMCPASVSAGGVLQEARVRIAVADPLTCSVNASIAVVLDRAGDLEQRLQRFDGSRVDGLEIGAAQTAGPLRPIGVTEALAIRFPIAGSHRYEVRYRVTQPEAWAYRCPVWLPAVAADGRSRHVEIEVTLPPAARPAGGSFPSFRWDGHVGRATLGHLPAFVHLPYAAPGESRPRVIDVAGTMDYVALGVLVAGTVLWVIRRRR